jgi:hypothetical protein
MTSSAFKWKLDITKGEGGGGLLRCTARDKHYYFNQFLTKYKLVNYFHANTFDVTEFSI